MFNNVKSHVHCLCCHTARYRLLQDDVRKRTRSHTLYVRTFHSPSHLTWETLPCHKTEALHVTHILSNSPMEAAVLFLCSLSTKSPRHVPTLSLFSFRSITANTSFSLQITMHVAKQFLRFIFLLPCPQPKLQYNRLSLKPHSPLPQHTICSIQPSNEQLERRD